MEQHNPAEWNEPTSTADNQSLFNYQQLEPVLQQLAECLEVPVAFISTYDKNHEHIQAATNCETQTIALQHSFTVHCFTRNEYTEHHKLSDDRQLSLNPLLEQGCQAVAYAGLPLHIGQKSSADATLNVLDYQDRRFNEKQKRQLYLAKSIIENQLMLGHELNKAYNRNQSAQIFDTVSGLGDEHYFIEQLEHELNKEHPKPLLVIAFSVDRLQEIYNYLSKKYFAELMALMGQRLKDNLTEAECLAQADFNRFYALFELDRDSDLECSSQIKHLLDLFQTPFELYDMNFRMDIHMGCAVSSEEDDDGESLVDKAVIAMQQHQNDPQKLYYFYRREHNANIKRIFELEVRFKDTMDKNGLKIALQPIISVSEEKTESFEALCRWYDEKLGWVSPGEFIPMAENAKLIRPMTYMIIDKILYHLASQEQPFPIAVNIPPQVLADPEFTEHLHDKLEQYGINSDLLRLEITENALINDFDLVKSQLDKLSQTKIHFGIDDFGTGFSSLSYLTHLPIDFVKLDKVFIDRMVNNKFDAAVVQKMVQLIHRLGYETVAEGIDTERKYIYIMAYQCTKAQGHYFGKAELID